MVGRILTFGAVAGLLSGGVLYVDNQSKREVFESEKAILTSNKEKYEALEARRDAALAEIKPYEDNIASINTLTESIQSLTEQIPHVKSELATLKLQIAQEVENVRLKATGMILPELVLASGLVLKQVEIKSVTDSDISLSHAMGGGRIPASDLPDGMRERFRMGMNPTVAAADNTVANATANASAPAVATPEITTPSVVLTQAMRDRISTMEDALRTCQQQQIQIQRTRQAYLAQAKDYREKDERNKFLGKPMRYQNVIPTITRTINTLDLQLAQLATKIVTLEIDVDNIKEGHGMEPSAAPGLPR